MSTGSTIIYVQIVLNMNCEATIKKNRNHRSVFIFLIFYTNLCVAGQLLRILSQERKKRKFKNET